MNNFTYNWYLEREQKKKEAYRRNEVSIINHQLQRILKSMVSQIDIEKYEKEIRYLENQYQVVGCSIVNLAWANNFENEKVALAQALLINLLARNEEDTLDDASYYERQADNFMRRLGNIDWGVLRTYDMEKRRLNV